jgi:hypothetical protein
MRNSDKINYVGFSTGGNRITGTKIRFTTDQVRRSKGLQKTGATNIIWYALPVAMTKAEAANYLQNSATSLNLDQVQEEAVSRAIARLVPEVK